MKDNTQEALAQQFIEDQEYDKAIPILKALYEKAPFDIALYKNYLKALQLNKNYKEAEDLVDYMMKIRRQDLSLYVDKGLIYEATNKNKEAQELYNESIEKLIPQEFTIKELADAFERVEKNEWAVKVYERARLLHQNPYIFATQLSILYTKLGKTKEAIAAVLDLAMIETRAREDVKESLIKSIDKDPKAFGMIQKELNYRLLEQANNPIWTELISWLFVQKGDYEGAYKELVQLDKKFEENGKRLIPFANEIIQDKQYKVAAKSYDYVLKLGKEAPYYEVAQKGKIELGLIELEQEWPASQNKLPAFIKEIQSFLTEFEKYKNTDFIRIYALVQARYNDQVDSAIEILETVIASKPRNKQFEGRVKLDLGDYLLLKNKIWDASLIYSQVDKDFKEDQLGEDARFKNAKLAYYRGDFEWAQGQLSVLKASTTRLIANDALYLSVLITENITDSASHYPLSRFAYADLLLFQNKLTESKTLLDSLASAFPESPLLDDIDMLNAQLSLKSGDISKAIDYLKNIVANFGDDVLADDAIYQLAVIYQDRLKDNQQALFYYEKLIVEYSGSTFVQDARKQYNILKEKVKNL